MEAFLAKRIVDGYLSFSEVPKSLKEEVKANLINNGREDLVNE